MKKDFRNWHTGKEDINDNKNRPRFYDREVWFTSLGANIGHEQDGKGKKFLRPILVVKKFNNDVLLAVPLTSNGKVGTYYYPCFVGTTPNTVILSQIRLIDAKRLQYKKGEVSLSDFLIIKEKIKHLLD